MLACFLLIIFSQQPHFIIFRLEFVFCFDFWVLDVAVCTGPGFTEISPLRINSPCVAMELL